MKKITLLLGVALLLEYSAFAQKNNLKQTNNASIKKSIENNFENYKITQSNSPVLQKQNSKQINAYYLESFEGSFPPEGWTKQNLDSGTGWAQAANGTTPLNGWGTGTQDVPPGGGNFVAYCTYYTGGVPSSDQWLISPQFNVSLGDSLKFSLWRFGNYQDTLQILLSTTSNSIANFTTTLLQVDTLILTPMGSWKKNSISLTSYIGQNVYIAFREKVSDIFTSGAYIALDLFSIGTPYALDAGISAKIAPVDACGLGNEDVTVIVQNNGTTTISNLPVHYTVNGGTPVNEIISNVIPANSSVNYTFTSQASLSALDEYTIKAYTSLTGDENNADDTLTFTVSKIDNSLPPYSMGFEPVESFAGWLIEDANNDKHTWSIVYAGGNTGPYCAIYSYNATNAANDWLFSKCILLDASKNYKLYYRVRTESGNFPESLKVQIGNAPASTAMTTLIDDLPNITNTVYSNREVNFTVPSNGVYYFGWKCYSAANMWNLYLDDINISAITGIEESVTSTYVSVYPNPAKDILNIYSSAKIVGIKLFNVYGQLVLSRQMNSDNTAINTVSLADGIYYLQVETKDGIVTKNVTISK